MAVDAKSTLMAVPAEERILNSNFCLTGNTGTEVNQVTIRMICLGVMLFPTLGAIGESFRMIRWLVLIPVWSEEHHRDAWEKAASARSAILFR